MNPIVGTPARDSALPSPRNPPFTGLTIAVRFAPVFGSALASAPAIGFDGVIATAHSSFPVGRYCIAALSIHSRQPRCSTVTAATAFLIVSGDFWMKPRIDGTHGPAK